jgi:hypothetical protein
MQNKNQTSKHCDAREHTVENMLRVKNEDIDLLKKRILGL